MPQQDSGPEQRNNSSFGLEGAISPNGATATTFGAPPYTNGATMNAFLSGTEGKESAKKSAPKSSLETALTGGNHPTTWQDGHIAANSNTLEYFRRIYLSLQPANSLDTMPTVGVTSAMDGEGKSTIALGISTAMAADLDSPIVLVELNLTRPSIHKSLGIPAQPGLSEYLRGECSLPQALRQITENLFVLPAGDCRNDPARLIRMLTRANLLLRMDNSGAVLVLDLPPVLTASYGVLASSMADAVVMVVRAGQTPEKMVKDAIARLDESTLRGIILNAARPSIPTWLGGYL